MSVANTAPDSLQQISSVLFHLQRSLHLCYPSSRAGKFVTDDNGVETFITKKLIFVKAMFKSFVPYIWSWMVRSSLVDEAKLSTGEKSVWVCHLMLLYESQS